MLIWEVFFERRVFFMHSFRRNAFGKRETLEQDNIFLDSSSQRQMPACIKQVHLFEKN